MATVKEVLTKYHKIVPFPITPAKIEQAGQPVTAYLYQIVTDLKRCTDANTPRAKKTIKSLDKLFDLMP